MAISNEMKENFEDLAEKIITKEELIFFLEEISVAQKEIFKKEEGFLSKKVEGRISEDLKKYSKNPEQQFYFLEQLKKYLLNIPQVKLEIVFSPSANFLNKISSWLKKEIGKKIFLDLVLNPEIVGGVIIEYQGKYRNFSLAKEIDKIIAEKRI